MDVRCRADVAVNDGDQTLGGCININGVLCHLRTVTFVDDSVWYCESCGASYDEMEVDAADLVEVAATHAALSVDLGHDPNVDIPGGYWQDGNPNAPQVIAKCVSPAHAALIVRAYIKRNGLGAGNWTGGLIRQDNVPWLRVSYNGRIWHLSDPKKEFTA